MENGESRQMTGYSSGSFSLALLVCLHILTCCVSLIYVATFDVPHAFVPGEFHIFFDPARWYAAVIVAAGFALFSAVFVCAGFSFGYFVGFYLYTMILGYLWLGRFTDLSYNSPLAALSAAASAVAFLLPALFVTSPLRQSFTLTPRSFDRLLTGILILGFAIIAVGAIYNFHLVTLEAMYEYRARIEFPPILNYLLAIFTSTLLPFAFAGFVTTKARWRGAAVFLLLLFLYPITLSKTALLTPFWLVLILVLSRLFEARKVTVISLLGPILAGVVLIGVFGPRAALYFATINFRMVAVPSLAMDVYNDFFFNHDLTHFCQISLLKHMMSCPYQDPLSAVMQQTYELGSFNASLFATEGIASVGPMLAPLSALICGLVIAVGNRLSAGLPPGFVLISAAIIPHALLNVPLSTVLVTHGVGFLFLLWYVTPRAFCGTITVQPDGHQALQPTNKPEALAYG